jgi:copper(I)-binding protein
MRHVATLTPSDLVVGFLLAVAGLVTAGQAEAQAITATDAWARHASAMTPMEKKGSMGKMEKMGGDMAGMSRMGDGATSAVYVTLTNTGSQADALVSAASDAAKTAELHEVQHDQGGVMKMRPVKSIPIPASGKVELKPGGYHIMLLGLTHDFKAGDKVPVTLKFEHGGELRIEAAVR